MREWKLGAGNGDLVREGSIAFILHFLIVPFIIFLTLKEQWLTPLYRFQVHRLVTQHLLGVCYIPHQRPGSSRCCTIESFPLRFPPPSCFPIWKPLIWCYRRTLVSVLFGFLVDPAWGTAFGSCFLCLLSIKILSRRVHVRRMAKFFAFLCRNHTFHVLPPVIGPSSWL